MLVVAPGHTPTFFPRTDPRSGPLRAELEPRTNLPPASQIILGRVVDTNGKPVSQAVVSVETTQIGDTGYGSPPGGTDPLAVSDDDGLFSLGSSTRFDSMELKIEARARARGMFNNVRPGRARRDFVLTEGVTIAGRVLRNRQAVSNVVIGACGTDRTVGNFTGDFVVATQPNGQFALTYLPPNREYFVYGLLNSLTNLGHLPLRRVKTGRDGATVDLGDLPLQPGKRLAGRVELSDAQPLPENTRVLIAREEAWDTLTLDLSPQGQFEAINLPPGETLGVSSRVKGYRPSSRNASFEALNGFGLSGRLDTDKTNLVLLLEPGEPQPGDFEPGAEEDRPQNRPLGGIETARVRTPGRTIRGEVVDAKSGQPLKAFRITPGQAWQADASYVQWLQSRAVDGTNGVFTVEVPKQTKFAVVQAEADGYLPERSPGLQVNPAQWRFALRKGKGPSGIVRHPDGQPAVGAVVVHFGPGEQASLPASGDLVANTVRDGVARTDGEGRFEFPPKVGPSELVVATDTGFCRVPAAEAGRPQELKLEPWARVTGRLVKGSGPLADEAVELQPGEAFRPGAPFLNHQGAHTDEAGRFTFERIPPGHFSVGTRQTVGEGSDHGWTVLAHRKFEVRPGATLDLGDVKITDGSGARNRR